MRSYKFKIGDRVKWIGSILYHRGDNSGTIIQIRNFSNGGFKFENNYKIAWGNNPKYPTWYAEFELSLLLIGLDKLEGILETKKTRWFHRVFNLFS